MSRINNNKSQTVSVSKKSNSNSNKAFCGACQKAGKTMEEYTSHWTRSKPGIEGLVTCPLILASECGYCHEMGHWTKFCPLLANKTVVDIVVEKQVKKDAKSATAVKTAKVQKGFDMLYMSDDEEEDEDETKPAPRKPTANVTAVVKKPNSMEAEKDKDFPALTLKKSVKLSLDICLPKESMSWAAMVQKPVVPLPVVGAAPAKMKKFAFPKMKKVLNWADDDSDSDEEEDEEFYTEFVPTGVYA